MLKKIALYVTQKLLAVCQSITSENKLLNYSRYFETVDGEDVNNTQVGNKGF